MIGGKSPHRCSVVGPRTEKERSRTLLPDPKTDWREYKKAKLTSAFNRALNSIDGMGSKQRRTDSKTVEGLEPFGQLRVTVRKAHICGRKCNKKAGTHFYGIPGDSPGRQSSQGGVSSGYDEAAFLCTVTFEDSFKQTPPANGFEPNFGDRTFEFDVMSYQSKVYFDLFDEFSSNLIGDCAVGLFGIVEKNVQVNMKRLGGLRANYINVPGERKITVLETLRNVSSSDEFEWVNLKDSRDCVVGMVMVNFSFREHVMASFSTRPPSLRTNPEDADPEFALEALKSASMRISKLMRMRNEFEVWYRRILEFEQPFRSTCWLVGSVVFFLTMDPEYLPFHMAGLMICVFLHNLKARIDGSSVLHLLHDPQSSGLRRTIGKLRVAVVSASELDKEKVWTGKLDPLVRCYYSIGECSDPTHGYHEEQTNNDYTTSSGSNQHRYYIGRTQTIQNTTTPYFQNQMVGGEENDKATDAATKNIKNIQKKAAYAKTWFIARSRLRKAGVRDAVLHNVTSSWRHEDGAVDWHCLKYPILQETENKGKKVKKWEDISSSLHFDLHHAGSAGEKFLGRAILPMSALINKGGGIQKMKDLELKFYSSKGKEMGKLRVRLQLKLPDVGAEFTELNRMNMESLEEMLNNELHLGIVGRVKRVRDLAISVQMSLENIANVWERAKNLVLWVHPKKTSVVLAYIFVGCIVSFFIKFRYLMVMKILNDFRKGLKGKRSRKFYNRVNNLLNTLPTAKDMSDIYQAERDGLKKITAAVQHTQALQVALQALWSGEMCKRGTFNTAFKERFVIVRSGYICWWKSVKNAERGMPARGRLYLSTDPPLISDVRKTDKGTLFTLKGQETLEGNNVLRHFSIESGFEEFKNCVEAACMSNASDLRRRNELVKQNSDIN